MRDRRVSQTRRSSAFAIVRCWIHQRPAHAAFLGLHQQVDERLQYHSHRCRVLPPLLQYSLHRITELDPPQDRRAVAELRGHTHELPGESRHPEAAYQSDAAEAVQRHHGGRHQVGDASRRIRCNAVYIASHAY